MQTTEFIGRLTGEMPGQHRIFPPLEDAELEAWYEKWPRRSLPKDLLAMLRQTNGIQFWVNEGSPEGYYRLLSLQEVDSARRIMWGEYAEDLDDDDIPYPHWLAISQHQDGAYYIILDTDEHRYYLMDTSGADLESPVGDNVGELLDFIWEDWVEALAEDLEEPE
jgi:hypothetical protein